MKRVSRTGVSFVVLFLLQITHQFSGEEELKINWTPYHSYGETTTILKNFAQEYEGLSQVYSIGKGFQSKKIWCAEITDYSSGEPDANQGCT